MSEQRTRRDLLRALGGVGTGAVAGIAGCLGGDPGEGAGGGRAGSATVFHAGSLAPPFSAAEEGFESATGIAVTREAKGSVASTKKVTVQGRSADALGVADYRLLRDRVVPEFGDWYAVFATNAMAIQYREDSPGADEMATDTWPEVLSREGVTVGHSDPAIDPAGYRAVMTQQLGAIPFRGERLYDGATRRALRANSTISTGTEVNLTAQVRSGKIDYALYYRSLCETADLPWVELQPEVDLSRATDEYARHYARAEVETDSGTFTGAPIAYGITVPSVARNPESGARWVEHFLGGEGREVLADQGLVPVAPAVVPASGAQAVPERVLAHAEPKRRMGPLEL